MTAPEKLCLALMNWSGGKDSALALYRLRQQGHCTVVTLLTTVNQAYGRVSMHGVRRELIQAQADRLGLPLHTLDLPEQTTILDYTRQMADALHPWTAAGVTHSVFGDIFLADLRQWREQQLASVGLRGEFPLWQLPTPYLLDTFWETGFRAVVVAVNGQTLDRSFCGRPFDRAFVNDLPATVDPCGENGEFHTFVVDAPYFVRPIDYQLGETVERTYSFTDAQGIMHQSSYYFTDVLPIL